MKIALYGDVGAWLKPFLKGLQYIGLTEDNHLPPDVVVIQVGDLIDRGPHSNKTVQLVADCMKKNPGQWIQLLGNHDAAWVGGPQFWASDEIAASTKHTLADWWDSKQAHTAVGVKDHRLNEEYLVTHSGVVRRFWLTALQGVKNLPETVKCINDLPSEEKFWAGEMLGGWAKYVPGPMWASTNELYIPWLNCGSMPWSQIHGHCLSFNWDANKWNNWTPVEIAKLGVLDREHRHYYIPCDNHKFLAIDPGLRRVATRDIIYPYIIEDGEIVI